MVMSLFSCIALLPCRHLGMGKQCNWSVLSFGDGGFSGRIFFLGFWQVWPLGVPGKVSFCVLGGGLGQGTEG